MAEHDLVDEDGIHRGFTGPPIPSDPPADIHTGITGPPVVRQIISEIEDEEIITHKVGRGPRARTAARTNPAD